MANPEYVKIKDKKYKINTDYRVALKCDEVARDTTISDYERTIAIIYLLYGEDGIDSKDDYEELLRLAIKYLSCGQEYEDSVDEVDMDFRQDIGLIKASFKSDYGIVLDNENMHWWDFYMYLNGLTEKCILNRVRELRNYNVSEIRDSKEKKKIEKAKKRFALKQEKIKLTKEQEENIENFYKLTGLQRKE